jgi:hypothetical protein
MEQYKSVLIGLLIALGAGIGAYFLWPETTHAPSDSDIQKSNEQQAVKESIPSQAPTGTKTAPVPPKTTTPVVAQPVTKGGTYEPYSATAVGYAALGEVVLFFHSPSCPAKEQ